MATKQISIGKYNFTPIPYELRGFQSREIQEKLNKEWLTEDSWFFYIQHVIEHLADWKKNNRPLVIETAKLFRH